ncbi:hypothetical protein A4X09_0g1422 [Tilletia walkeri]|uniref:BHLH domain-containing protein n=1 Tax=Tilletia walkeri TaxID=117179 RepID=A0A8X7NBL8_9BASI|nr:hypothetical protein A4X09_0g1422 [Tilletia walkeri]
MTSSASPTDHPSSSSQQSLQQCSIDTSNLMPSDLQQFEMLNTLGLISSSSSSAHNDHTNNGTPNNNEQQQQQGHAAQLQQDSNASDRELAAATVAAANNFQHNGNGAGSISNGNGNSTESNNPNCTPTASMSQSSSSSIHGIVPGISEGALQLGNQDFYNSFITGPSSSLTHGMAAAGGGGRDQNGMPLPLRDTPQFWPAGSQPDPRFVPGNFVNMSVLPDQIPTSLASVPTGSMPQGPSSAHAPHPSFLPRGNNMGWQQVSPFPFNGQMPPGMEQAPYPFDFNIKSEAGSPSIHQSMGQSYPFHAVGGGQMTTPFKGQGNGGIQQTPGSNGMVNGHHHQTQGRITVPRSHPQQQQQIPSQASPTGRGPHPGPLMRFGNPNHHPGGNNTNFHHHPAYLDTAAVSPFSPTTTTSSSTTLVGSISAAGSPAKRRASEMGSDVIIMGGGLGLGSRSGSGQQSAENSLEGGDDSLDLSLSIGAISTNTTASGGGHADASSPLKDGGGGGGGGGGASLQGSTSLPVTDYGSVEYQHRKDVVRKRRLNSEARRRTELQEHFETLRKVLAQSSAGSQANGTGGDQRVVKAALLQRAIDRLSSDGEVLRVKDREIAELRHERDQWKATCVQLQSRLGGGAGGPGGGGFVPAADRENAVPPGVVPISGPTGSGSGAMVMGMGPGAVMFGSVGGMMGNNNNNNPNYVGVVGSNGSSAQAFASHQQQQQAQQQQQQRFVGVVRSPRHQNAALQQMNIQHTGGSGGPDGSL